MNYNNQGFRLTTSTPHEIALWNRALDTTGKPKVCLLARQILDTKYFREMKDFCQKLAASHWNIQGFLITEDEVEGAIRAWADRADFKPLDEFEMILWPILDTISREFKGWKPSKGPPIDLSSIADHETSLD